MILSEDAKKVNKICFISQDPGASIWFHPILELWNLTMRLVNDDNKT